MSRPVIFVFLFVFFFALIGLLLHFSSVSGMAQYGVNWPIIVPDEAEERLGYGYWPVIEKRSLLTHERQETSSRVAWMQRQLSPKSAPLEAPSQIIGRFCIKKNGEEGRTYSPQEVERGYGVDCEVYVTIEGIYDPGNYCCSLKTLQTQQSGYPEHRP